MAISGKIRASDHESHATMTVIAILIPIVGVILGIVLLTKQDPYERKLGEHTLALSVAVMLLGGFLLWIVGPVFLAGV